MAAVGLVLLSTCVNVANLFLVRSLSRGRELAVRAALGAGRGGLLRQLLTESLVLSTVGGGLGLVLAWVGIEARLALAPEGLPRISEIDIDGTVLVFTLAVSLLTGLVFGLAPTIRFSMLNLGGDLRERERGSTGGRRHRRLRSVLVVSEVAVALVLLVGAGVLVRSFSALRSLDPNLVLFRVRSMETLLADSVSRQRFSMLLMGVFSIMALLLAAVGIYGVLSYLVSQRIQEIGIRMALGAEAAHVRRQVVGHGLALTGSGIAVGVLVALFMSRWLRGLVFQVRVTDPWVMGIVILGMGLVALISAYLPARRATRVDPVVAFRGE